MNSAGSVVLTKTTGITGYSSFQGTAPNDYNALVTWGGGQLNVTPGLYTAELDATVGGRQRPFPGDIVIEITAVAA